MMFISLMPDICVYNFVTVASILVLVLPPPPTSTAHVSKERGESTMRTTLGTPLGIQCRVMYIIYKYIVYNLLVVHILRPVACVPQLI
jgi:hypothetical protein